MQLPPFHFIDHRIEILQHDEYFNQVVLYEQASARDSPFKAVAAKWITDLKEEKSLSVFKACSGN